MRAVAEHPSHPTPGGYPSGALAHFAGGATEGVSLNCPAAASPCVMKGCCSACSAVGRSSGCRRSRVPIKEMKSSSSCT